MQLVISLQGNRKSKQNFLFLLVVASLTFLLSVFTVFNHSLSLIVIILQDSILLALILANRIDLFTSFYVIFLASSFESASFFSNIEISFWGFKSLQIFGLSNNLIVAIISMSIFFVLNHRKKLFPLKQREFFPVYMLAIMNFFAFCIGFMNLVIGDNGADTSIVYLYIFLGEAYYGFDTMLMLLFAYLSFSTSKDRPRICQLFISTILAILISQCYVPYIAYFAGFRGGYGGNLLTTYTSLIIPTLILFPLFYKTKIKLFIYFSWIVGSIIPIIFFQAGSGKGVLLLSITILLYTLYRIRNKSIKKNRVILIMLILSITVFMLYVVLPFLGNQDIMFAAKAKQAYSMVNFFSNNYLEDMLLSPQVRLYEVLTVLKEYMIKPWSLLFGKGFGGSFKDHFGYFSAIPTQLRAGMFTDFQFANNYYFRMHELARIFLIYGLFGVSVSILILKQLLKNLSPLSLLGAIWVILFINNSQTLSCVLILAFVTSFYERLLPDKEIILSKFLT